MEIEIGEYVRTDTGIIDKIINIQKFENGEVWLLGNNIYILFDNTIKYSKRILDLIEEDDYVNYGIVSEVIKDKNNKTKYIIVTCKTYEEQCFEEQIERIVTKEQFKNIEYKVEE